MPARHGCPQRALSTTFLDESLNWPLNWTCNWRMDSASLGRQYLPSRLLRHAVQLWPNFCEAVKGRTDVMIKLLEGPYVRH